MSINGKERERESEGGGRERGRRGYGIRLFVPLFAPAKGKKKLFVVEMYIVT